MLNTSDLRAQRPVSNTPVAPAAAPYGFPTSSSGFRHACPLCRGALARILRRPIDRFTSHFVPVHRFRCEGFSCGWQGNLRVEVADSGKKTSILQRTATAAVVVLTLVASVAVVAMLVVTMIGWFTARDQTQEQVGSLDTRYVVAIHAPTAATG